jgi:hypothetical protein
MTEIERLQDAKRRALAIADERAKENVRLRAERDLLVRALEDIKQATIDGRVCDDVAWFSPIETLHDFCDRTLSVVGNACMPPSSLSERGK